MWEQMNKLAKDKKQYDKVKTNISPSVTNVTQRALNWNEAILRIQGFQFTRIPMSDIFFLTTSRQN